MKLRGWKAIMEFIFLRKKISEFWGKILPKNRQGWIFLAITNRIFWPKASKVGIPAQPWKKAVSRQILIH